MPTSNKKSFMVCTTEFCKGDEGEEEEVVEEEEEEEDA
jgi:hypothetical protein